MPFKEREDVALVVQYSGFIFAKDDPFFKTTKT